VSILVIGVHHRTGPLELLERLAIADDDLPKVLHGLMSRPDVREALVLSTCNRTEIYAVAERFHGAFADLRDTLCELGSLSPEELHPHLYTQHDEAAVTHLFEVTAGLDSSVLGETEIVGQVRRAWERAHDEGATRSTLNGLFRHALEVGKRARTETAISRSTASVSHAAVEMAHEHLDGLAARHVLVIGAGEVGQGVATALAGAGADRVTVLNRTVERGQALAERVGADMAPLTALNDRLPDADVVVTCVGAGQTVLDVETVKAALQSRPERPMLVIDLAVPRDVEVAVGELGAVTRYDLDDLRDWAARGVAARQAEVDRVRTIVGEEVERFAMDATARQAAPLVASLHDLADRIRVGELDRHHTKLSTLDDDQRAAVEALTRGIVAKLLHGPSVRLKGEAGTPRGERYAAAVRELFDLG
jgi:glutamyl-tRNA reductase